MSAFFDHFPDSLLMSVKFGHVLGVNFKLVPNDLQIVRERLHGIQLVFGL